MINREKEYIVEKLQEALEKAENDGRICAEIRRPMVFGAIGLLKEQEAKQVKLYGKEEWIGLSCLCPDCKARWMGSKSETHFCPNCGKAVKWDA